MVARLVRIDGPAHMRSLREHAKLGFATSPAAEIGAHLMDEKLPRELEGSAEG